MTKQIPVPEVGDLYEDKDPRNEGRIIRVTHVLPLTEKVRAETEVHPHIPSAVGREVRVSWKNLGTRYKKVSR